MITYNIEICDSVGRSYYGTVRSDESIRVRLERVNPTAQSITILEGPITRAVYLNTEKDAACTAACDLFATNIDCAVFETSEGKYIILEKTLAEDTHHPCVYDPTTDGVPVATTFYRGPDRRKTSRGKPLEPCEDLSRLEQIVLAQECPKLV